ncbi:hypothetical protein T07_235 [Trichinella nelsoni]|uniref:Uncharacterized protein n=1 Tax=Trichinella nelsoni TaxID=6336 RepID=A0A0V0S574_9BILA|nr:hypothetical protein T07_235 [Trichinella nelsoni]
MAFSTSIIDRFIISKLKDHSIRMIIVLTGRLLVAMQNYLYIYDHCLQIITTDNYGKHYGVEN